MYRTDRTTLLVGRCGRLLPPPRSAPDAHAHHAFATEFDANLDGRGQRRGHARLVAEPAHPLRRRDEDAGRLDARAGRCCRPAICRRIGARIGPSRPCRSATQVTATGNLGRDGTKKLYATCINVGSGPEKGRAARPLRELGHRHADDGRSERRLHRDTPTSTRSTSAATGTTATSSKSPSTTSSRSRCR